MPCWAGPITSSGEGSAALLYRPSNRNLATQNKCCTRIHHRAHRTVPPPGDRIRPKLASSQYISTSTSTRFDWRQQTTTAACHLPALVRERLSQRALLEDFDSLKSVRRCADYDDQFAPKILFSPIEQFRCEQRARCLTKISPDECGCNRRGSPRRRPSVQS